MRPLGCEPERRLLEPGRELGDDARAQHVRHLQDFALDRVVILDVRGIVALQPVRGLLQRQVQVGLHHGLHVAQGPVLRVSAVQEAGNFVGIVVPALAGRLDLGLVTRLGRRQKISRYQDVILEQRSQLVSGLLAVERLEGRRQCPSGSAAAAWQPHPYPADRW